jgi:hypothetical protein
MEASFTVDLVLEVGRKITKMTLRTAALNPNTGLLPGLP